MTFDKPTTTPQMGERSQDSGNGQMQQEQGIAGKTQNIKIDISKQQPVNGQSKPGSPKDIADPDEFLWF